MVRPVWPIWKRCGFHPASTAARDAPTAAPMTPASSSSSTKFSGPLSPRPPDTTISASVSSGSPVCASSRRSTKRVAGVAAPRLWRSTEGARPGSASATLKTFGRRVATHGPVFQRTRDRILPA